MKIWSINGSTRNFEKKKITFKGQRGGDGERSVSAQALES